MSARRERRSRATTTTADLLRRRSREVHSCPPPREGVPALGASLCALRDAARGRLSTPRTAERGAKGAEEQVEGGKRRRASRRSRWSCREGGKAERRESKRERESSSSNTRGCLDLEPLFLSLRASLFCPLSGAIAEIEMKINPETREKEPRGRTAACEAGSEQVDEQRLAAAAAAVDCS